MSDLDLKKILAPDKKALEELKEDETPKAPEEPGGDAKSTDPLLSLISPQKKSNEKIIDSYGNVEIVDIGEQLNIYRLKLPHLTPADKSILDSIQKVATKIIDIRKESSNSDVRKQSLKEKIYDMIAKTSSIKVSDLKMDAYADMISREMGGYGLLDYLMDDDKLEEVMVVPPHCAVFVFHREHGMLRTTLAIDSDEYIKNIIERIARDVSRRIDTNNPLLDARLPSGDRVNATLNPASVDGSSITIRKFREDPYTLVDMINFKTINPEVGAFLWLCAEGMQTYPCNILISGGTSSGKTTFLNCVSMFIRPTERVLTIEDTAELRLPLKHWVRMETRPPSIEGTGEIPMDVLLKNSLRMRPDRIIVGEVRHAEAFTLFTAMNTGHQGSMGTIHANTSDETLVRLMSPPMNVPEQMATALDLVVVLNRINIPKKGLVRRVTEIAEITGNKKPDLHPLYAWDSTNDTLTQLDKASYAKKQINKYSGLSMDKINNELKLRENLLAEAAKRKISSIGAFSVFLQKYYERQK
jgi:flagellar protein FlaI